MNDEETKILDSEDRNQSQNENNKKADTSEKAAYAGGGFAAGVAAGVTGSAFAAQSGTASPEVAVEVDTPAELEEAEANESINAQATPEPEEILLATDEGIKVAQVDDSASFGEAFADARAQVGAGGVFEWRGQVYGTYYEEEWANMSAAERAEYHNKIDYSSIIGAENTENEHSSHSSHASTTSSSASTHESPSSHTNTNHSSEASETIPTNTEMVDDSYTTDEIKVLGIEAVTDQYGNQGTMASIEIDGMEAIMVDVDNDGTMDFLVADVNGNGQVDEGEMKDISQNNVETTDLQQMMDAQMGNDIYMASNDNMPDYVNDADISSLT